MQADQNSHRVYVTLKSADIALFRFLLESYSHLALFTMVSRGGGQRPAVLKLRHAPDAGADLEHALHAMAETVSFDIVPAPLLRTTGSAEKTP